MRHRNKLLLIFFVFFFALLFVLGFIAASRQYAFANVQQWVGQIGLLIAIVLYFLVPDGSKRD